MDGESARDVFQVVELGQETAKMIAALVWDATQYRYMFVLIFLWHYFCLKTTHEQLQEEDREP
jgi:hypothetical protein